MLNMEDQNMMLCRKLEELTGRRTIAIIYNPEYEEGIMEGDENFLMCAIQQETKFQKLNNCNVILSGSGGDFRTALLMSYLLRNKLAYYSCFVPSVAGSSMCYLILHANKLIMGKESLLTQIDPIFEHDGESYRALKQLSSPIKELSNKAHDIWQFVYGQLEKLLSHKHSLLGSRKVNLGDLSPLIYLFMGKECHEDGVRYQEISRLNLNLDLAPEDQILLGKKLVSGCWDKASEEGKRLIIQTKHGSYVLDN